MLLFHLQKWPNELNLNEGLVMNMFVCALQPLFRYVSYDTM